MWEYITYLLENIVTALKDFGIWLLDLIPNIFQTVAYWIFDKFCTFLEWVFSIIDFKNSMFDAALSWSHFPSEMIWIMNQCGVDNLLLIISAALLIRLTLNLMPSWMTRV